MARAFCSGSLLAAAIGTLLTARPLAAASLTQVQSYGSAPTQARMYVYAPDNLTKNPATLVVLPYCGGTANAMFTNTQFRNQADQFGFLEIYPEPTSSDGCWDVHSPGTLTHGGNGDSGTIVAMVKYALMKYAGNPNRVYATGVSSGAMLTDVLLGAYPDVFRGGAIFAGVPYGCFAGSSGWNQPCADGTITKTAQEWGDLARSGYPGYSGLRPRVQIWHGTADETLNYHNFGEEIKQWTNVLGVSQTPTTTEMNQPLSGYTRTRYLDGGGVARVEAVSEANQPHALNMPADQVVKFFGLDGTTDPGFGGMGGASGAGGAANGGAGLGGAGGAFGGSGTGGSGAGGSGAGGAAGLELGGAPSGGRAGAGFGGMPGRGGHAAVSAGGTTGGRGGAAGASGASGSGRGGTGTAGVHGVRSGESGATFGGQSSGASGGAEHLGGASYVEAGDDPAEIPGSNGCGCRVSERRAPGALAWFAVGLAVTAARSRSRRRTDRP